MGVPSDKLAKAKQSKRIKNDTIKFNKLSLSALIGLTLALVILNIGVGKCNSENEQHLYYKELERLKQQIYSKKFTWPDTTRHNENRYERVHNRHPQETYDLPNYGVVHQEQRQHLSSNNQDLQLSLQHKNSLKTEHTKYTPWTEKEQYHSSTAYNALGMAPLYNITNIVIDFFVDAEEPIPDGEYF